MNAKPILFNDKMVSAILAGEKTQTRRVARPQPHVNEAYPSLLNLYGAGWGKEQTHVPVMVQHSLEAKNPYGRRGDSLWVRESHALVPSSAYAKSEGVRFKRSPDGEEWAVYRTGWVRSAPKWRPSIHIHRWASRITLKIEDLALERVNIIDDTGARAEGVKDKDEFKRLWDSINAKRGYSWDDNPWVWVISFSAERTDAVVMPRRLEAIY